MGGGEGKPSQFPEPEEINFLVLRYFAARNYMK